ncbi:MAG: hypothetical protein ACLFUJ_04875 [Phycisphaerae bacterium]
MSHNFTDDLGQVCRWMLLTLAGLFVLTTGWAILASLEQAPLLGEQAFAAGDYILDPRKESLYFGIAADPPLAKGPLGMARLEGQSVRLLKSYAPGSFLLLAKPMPGQQQSVPFLGPPYTRLALSRAASGIRRIPRNQPLLLLHSDMLAGDSEKWARWVGQQDDRRNLAAICPAAAQQLDRQKRSIDQHMPDLPVLFVQDPDGRWPLNYRNLINVAERRNFHNAIFVTDQPAQARAWDRLKYKVVLLASSPEGPLPESIRLADSLERLAETLDSASPGR